MIGTVKPIYALPLLCPFTAPYRAVNFDPEASKRASLHEKNPSIKRIRSVNVTEGFGKTTSSPRAKQKSPAAYYFDNANDYLDMTAANNTRAQQKAIDNHESLDLDQQQWHNFTTTTGTPSTTTTFLCVRSFTINMISNAKLE